MSLLRSMLDRQTLSVLFSRRMGICLGTGFASGMPLYVLTQLLPAWFTDYGLDLTTIGMMALVMLPYTWKFVWAPLLDRYAFPGVGRRKSWAAASQLALIALLASLAFLEPHSQLELITAVSVGIAFASATQDIAVDALRRELLADEELGLGNAVFVNAYRIASLVPGSLALILADRYPWAVVHLVVAACMTIGLITTFMAQEPAVEEVERTSLLAGLREPIQAFFTRNGFTGAAGILAFMLLYKLGDSMATALATPFYLGLGFTMTQVGTVAKVAALWASIGGGIVGGLLMLRIGIHRALWVFGVVQLVSILGFAALSVIGPDEVWLFWVVSFEYLGVGLGTAAFVSFIASVTDPRYTATQLALLTSLTGLPRTFANAASGYLVDSIGWTSFFLACALLALPGMAMLPWIAPWNRASEPSVSA